MTYQIISTFFDFSPNNFRIKFIIIQSSSRHREFVSIILVRRHTCFEAFSSAPGDFPLNKSMLGRKQCGQRLHCRHEINWRKIPFILSATQHSSHSISRGCFSHSYNKRVFITYDVTGFPGRSKCLSRNVFSRLKHRLRLPPEID